MIDYFYLYLITGVLILLSSFSKKKSVGFVIYALQTIILTSYFYLLEDKVYSNLIIIVLAASFLEAIFRYDKISKSFYEIRSLINLCFTIILHESFPLIACFGIVATDFLINHEMKQNKSDWLKNNYNIYFRSALLFFFQILILLTTGKVDLDLSVQNSELGYITFLIGLSTIYCYLDVFRSDKEFKKILENSLNKTGILATTFLYSGTVYYIVRYLLTMAKDLDSRFIELSMAINVAIFLYLCLKFIYKFCLYTTEEFTAYRFFRVLLFSIVLVYLTNQASEFVLFKYAVTVVISSALFLSALNYNVFLKNEMLVLSLIGMLVLPFSPIYDYFEKGFSSTSVELIIAFSIILISCIMIYSTLNKINSSKEDKSLSVSRSQLIIIYGLAILGLNFI